MKKSLIILILLVLLPAFVLGGLALRGTREQRIVLERQQSELLQREAVSVAGQLRLAVNARFQSFKDAVQTMEGGKTGLTPDRFNEMLAERWPHPGVGFAVTLRGRVLSPLEDQSGVTPQARQFLRDNADFLGSREAVPLYAGNVRFEEELRFQQGGKKGWSDAIQSLARTQKEKTESLPDPELKNEIPQAVQAATGADSIRESARAPEATDADKTRALPAAPSSAEQNAPQAAVPAAAPAALSKDADLPGPGREPEAEAKKRQTLKMRGRNAEGSMYRNVAPVQSPVLPGQEDKAFPSQLVTETTLFNRVAATDRQGILARFVNDRLQLFFWMRSQADEQTVYGVMVDPKDLRGVLAPILADAHTADYYLALLDDRARPFAVSWPGVETDWKKPFVATEVGEVLPHWEVAVYLKDPDKLARAASQMSLLLTGLITLSMFSIGLGLRLIFRDTRRQMDLVRKKTDFVSNVSHELKTPLTSIRMFAELMLQGRVTEPAKVAHSLRIITLESERLTRLINNVLDFAKLERNEKRYHKENLDLYPLVERIWEGQEMHLKNQGFETKWTSQPGPYPVYGDGDAIAQVLINLLSNAEKYSTAQKHVELQTYTDAGWLHLSVLDRGLGVPAGEERKIFEHFYRAHDSLSSGIQGSGLGLTLARKIATDHGGTVTFAARKEGGSNFTLSLPLAAETGETT
ncbi:MAG: HAMP domain-containing sensor histidine kinase [Verrucomicrobiae bacterium]|nr:HAMP domain-containing sensor histidine kinase [Verrucomicrobiae bacterium]